MKMTIEKLQKAMEIQKQIEDLQNQMNDILSGEDVNRVSMATKPKKVRKMSKAGRESIAKAQRIRHANARLAKESQMTSATPETAQANE